MTAREPVAGHEQERPELFRRRRFEVAHRRPSLAVRLLRPLLTALVLVGGPTALGVWVVATPLFAVTSIEIAGTDRVAREWVSAALADLEGRHLLWIRLAEVEGRLASHPWVRGVALRKEPPDRLHVTLEERWPAALLRLHGELYFVEEDGHVIAPFESALTATSLPVLQVPAGSPVEIAPALRLAGEWRRLAPAWAGALEEIEILADEDFRVRAAGLPFPVLVALERLETGLERLAWLLPELRRQQPAVASVDVRFSRQIVIQPADEPQREEG